MHKIFFFQNYMHLAPLMLRMQQQQMESAMRQRFMANLAQARMQQQVVPPPFVPAAAEAVAPNFPVPTVPQGEEIGLKRRIWSSNCLTVAWKVLKNSLQ